MHKIGENGFYAAAETRSFCKLLFFYFACCIGNKVKGNEEMDLFRLKTTLTECIYERIL